MRELLQRIRDWFRREELDRELAEELAFHRALLERDAKAEGIDAARVSAAASRRLGNVTLAREDARERWSIPWLSQVLRDARYAMRGLRRSPGFTVTVVVTLGLGFGVNAAMFSVVDNLMFRPLAYLRDPASVNRLYWQWTDRDRVVTSQSGPYTRFLDVQRATTSFSQMAAFSERPLAVGEGAELQELRVAAVSASYFGFFDARPERGRFFVAAEDVTPRGADVAVLSHPFWQSRYGGRDVLGERLQIGNIRATIIGVAPRHFAGVNDAEPPVAWVPITTFAGSTGTGDAATYYSRYDWGWMHVLVRRKPGVTREQADADATRAFGLSWENARRDESRRPSVLEAKPRVAVSSVRPGAGPDPSLDAKTARWVLIVAFIVLLIATANVANLLVARALRRVRESAVRLALGASRGRLLTYSLVECLILVLLSAAAALLMSRWAAAGIRSWFTNAPVSGVPIATDWRAAGLTLFIALTLGVVIGASPSLLVDRGDLASRLRGGSRGGVAHGTRVRAMLLMVQGALSTVLLILALLFIRSLDAVRSMPMGYDAERVLLVTRVLQGTFPGDSAARDMAARLVRTAQALPDVESAAWAATVPFYSTSNTDLFVTGIDSVQRLGTFTYQVTTPDYFTVMRTRIVSGRALSADDRRGAPLVAVVSESMARVLWPGQQALGRCFRMRADTTPCIAVVGVAEDMVQRDLAGTQRLHYYIPLDQSARTSGNYMLLRVRGDPTELAERLRPELQRALHGGAYVTVRPLRTIVAAEQRAWRAGATMFALFGILALIITAVGLYGVIGYSVTQRWHELGVRAALGAGRADIVRMIVGQSVRYVLLGVAGGMTVAMLSGRAVTPLLFRQAAIDPVVYGGVALLMVAVAVVASAMPAMRASGVDPASALRAE